MTDNVVKFPEKKRKPVRVEVLTKIDREAIQDLIKDGYIRENAQEDSSEVKLEFLSLRPGRLFIYNYTDKAMYDKVWNEYTLQCRGLIADKEGNIIARPFPKFFNLHENNESLPLEDFEVYEKLDGSLGILYFDYDIFFDEDMPKIATRGSFVSPQAVMANRMLYHQYVNSVFHLDKTLTYLFEIIYPQNRIVVNYEDEYSLTLLAVIDTASGAELPLDSFAHLGFPLVKRYDGLADIDALTKLNESNREGFVVRFKNGLRIKIKFRDYIKLHSIITEMTSRKIWEVLKEGKSFSEFVEQIPDELFKWIKDKETELKAAYNKIESEARKDLDTIVNGIDALKAVAPLYKVSEQGKLHRQKIALQILKCDNPHVIFAMLDCKDYSKIIWKMLEPEHEIPDIKEYLLSDKIDKEISLVE